MIIEMKLLMIEIEKMIINDNQDDMIMKEMKYSGDMSLL